GRWMLTSSKNSTRSRRDLLIHHYRHMMQGERKSQRIWISLLRSLWSSYWSLNLSLRSNPLLRLIPRTLSTPATISPPSCH
ncbi:hypothetical protein BGZ80_008752, partial [Entomortierella chlamydospora]